MCRSAKAGGIGQCGRACNSCIFNQLGEDGKFPSGTVLKSKHEKTEAKGANTESVVPVPSTAEEPVPASP